MSRQRGNLQCRNEERVWERRDTRASVRRRFRGERTEVLIILERCINNRTGTDGHRTIGRTWHASRLTNSALAEAICLSIRNLPPLPHPEMIRSLLPLTIRGFCLCLATLKLYLILAGRSHPGHGEPCSSVSSRGNRSVTSPVNTACRMRRSGVYFVPRVVAKWHV